MTRPGWTWLGAGLAVAAAAATGVGWWHAGKADRSLMLRLQGRALAQAGPNRNCLQPAGRQVVLLVLGQSNAGNHGAENEVQARGDGPTVNVFDGSGCRQSADPLPGGTGRHRSVWTQLEPHLRRQGVQAEVLLALLAVDSSTIDDWTRDGSPLRHELSRLLQALSNAALKPDLVLWQHGESDTRQGTPGKDYERKFERLLAQLRRSGVDAPVVLARSTRCRNPDGSAVRVAQDHLVTRHAALVVGPDTDALDGILRIQDCHWSRPGLDAAARAWALAVGPLLVKH